MKTIKINFLGEKFTLGFVKSTYANNGNIYVGVYSPYGEPFTDLTVNLGIELEEKTAFIDTNNCDKSIINALERRGLIINSYRTVSSGFCIYPIYFLTDDFLNNWCENYE